MSVNQVEEIFQEISIKLDKEEKLFLVQKIISSLIPEKSTEKVKQEMDSPRIAGLHMGQAWISEDFDEPLPDEFWLGQGN